QSEISQSMQGETPLLSPVRTRRINYAEKTASVPLDRFGQCGAISIRIPVENEHFLSISMSQENKTFIKCNYKHTCMHCFVINNRHNRFRSKPVREDFSKLRFPSTKGRKARVFQQDGVHVSNQRKRSRTCRIAARSPVALMKQPEEKKSQND
ncbi:hypothetical protein PMAYCL1PPCAC_08073, partial [Pristionchus mayeri]